MRRQHLNESLELISDSNNCGIRENRGKSACLFIAADSPESYSPAGERLRNMALAGSSVFSKTVILTLGKTRRAPEKRVDSTVLLYTTGFSHATPFPISSLFDPIRLLAFLIRGLVLCLHYNPSYVVASMPPFETGIGGWILAKLLHKKLVIDYMDDWESSLSSQLTRYIPRRLMVPVFKLSAIVYSSSTLLFVVTPTLANRIRQRKIVVSMILVPNGADTLVFFPRKEESRKGVRMKRSLPLSKIVIAYCGSGTNAYYRLDLILLAAKSLPKTAKEKVFFIFYLYSGVEYLRRLKKAFKISDDFVEIRDPLPRGVLSEVMAACDAGLVPFDEEPYLLYAMSTKVYEYLSEGLYVISSGPRGGELNLFFSQNRNLGVFVRPQVKDFVSVFLSVVKNNESFFKDDSRNLRYSFVKENYDARKVMEKAMAKVSSLESGQSD
jgi:glycosyltransferase involved in cell wall biosynthesis